ncbi:MAG: right-handed parallel beta-helix repeat-containing protein [Paracoccaceae bacterium]|nr:right-handed parallel beta-helix repeat-containing protein [Paracoccaceae bacterium]
MDISITDGVALMPPPFSAGLGSWSYEDGTPGSGTYANQANAAFVPADQDFGGCLELQKTTGTQKLRYTGQTPILPGTYLRISARVKAMSGNLPTVRVGAWAGNAAGAVTGVPLSGPQVTLTAYGTVVTISAIVGVGNRRGVDMPWGMVPTYGFFGLDLTGPNGGILRIDDLVVEDVTGIFARKLMDWVDVRDYGAMGDGITDDSAAFAAADAAAGGGSVLASAGSYYLGQNVTFANPVRFEGTVTMPATATLSATRSFTLDTYEAAFGSEVDGFTRMLQALFTYTDHAVLDLGGRQVQLSGPIDVAKVTGISGSYSVRRVIRNGQLAMTASGNWADKVVTAQASYSASQPMTLSGIANPAQIPVGALVTGAGVGREVYVNAVNVSAGTVTLSQPLYAAPGTQVYTFTRFQYALDFSGIGRLDKFEIDDVEFYCSGNGSALMLPPVGTIFRISGCVFNQPKDRAITSIGTGCQGMLLDETQFLSNEQPVRAQDRKSIAFNVNANDTKIRNNRASRFRHTAVMNGSGHLIEGNHFFQGDNETNGVRLGGIILTALNCKTTITGNYIDDYFIEWSNEHDPTPNFSNEFSYGGLTIADNIFTVINVTPAFRWIVVAPKGTGHYLQGLNVSGNVFRPLNGNIDRVEMVDRTVAGLDFSRTRNVVFENNAFNAVNQESVSPVTLEFQQSSAAGTWVLDPSAYLPFGAWARYVTGVIAEGPITDGTGAAQAGMPYIRALQGAGNQQVSLGWPTAVKGKVLVTTRVDNPN